MLQTDLGGMYQYYHIMKYYGRYSMFEVDEMYPFERDIFYNFLADTKRKEKENN